MERGQTPFFAEFNRTGQEKGSDPFSFREPGINCEMCHGPSLAHVERLKAGGVAARATHDTPVRFSRLPAQQYVAVCSQCHAQSAVHNVEAGGNINYSEQVPFYRAYPAHLPSSFSRKAFFRDGRYRATTFISESFVRSQCFRKGEATCGSCHDPHPPDAATNPTSLKFRDDPDRMCLQCHAALADRPERHTQYAAGSEGSRCVSCHMPRIMDALLFPARSHEIDDVPDVEMTARFGKEGSPNACLMCHTDRGAEWLTRELQRWSKEEGKGNKEERSGRAISLPSSFFPSSFFPFSFFPSSFFLFFPLPVFQIFVRHTGACPPPMSSTQ